MARDHNEVEIERQKSAMLNKGYDHNEINNPNVRDHFNATGASADHYRKGGSGGSGGGCFPKGTKIYTPTGLKDIAAIKEGDLVYSKNKNTDILIAKPVLSVQNHSNKKIWKLTLSDGSCIRTTSVHSFHVGGQWKKASELRAGDQITYSDCNGKLDFKTVQQSYATKEVEDVFNLVIKDNYNFFAEGGFVHSFSYFRNLNIFLWRIRNTISNLNTSILENKIA